MARTALLVGVLAAMSSEICCFVGNSGLGRTAVLQAGGSASRGVSQGMGATTESASRRLPLLPRIPSSATTTICSFSAASTGYCSATLGECGVGGGGAGLHGLPAFGGVGSRMSGRRSRMGRGGNQTPMLRMSSSSPPPGSGDDEAEDDAAGMMGMKQQRPPSSTCPVPTDVSQAMQMCGAALTTAVQSGNRKVTIDILTPDLNPSSRGYDRANMHTMLIGVAQNMRKLVAGEVVFVFMDSEEAQVAEEAFGMSISIAADVGEDLIGCASLDEPLPEGPPPDVFVLVAPTNTKEKKITAQVRSLLKGWDSAIAVVVNQALDAPGPDGVPTGTLPLEMEPMHNAFFVEPFALQGGAPDQAPLRIAMTRSFPGNWGVWRFEDEDQVYILEREFGVKKPSRRILLEVCKDIIKARAKSAQ